MVEGKTGSCPFRIITIDEYNEYWQLKLKTLT
jgi:hypothetical protein